METHVVVCGTKLDWEQNGANPWTLQQHFNELWIFLNSALNLKEKTSKQTWNYTYEILYRSKACKLRLRWQDFVVHLSMMLVLIVSSDGCRRRSWEMMKMSKMSLLCGCETGHFWPCQHLHVRGGSSLFLRFSSWYSSWRKKRHKPVSDFFFVLIFSERTDLTRRGVMTFRWQSWSFPV